MSSRHLPIVGCPTHVPWEMVAPHEKQAILNHQQDLERLNSRGGLDPRELYAVLNDIGWRDALADEQQCVIWLVGKLAKYFEERT
jgi:hypothetical protein